MSFSTEINQFIEKTKIKGTTVLKKIAFDAYTGVTKKSPVDTGRFRASWQLGVNTVDLTTASEGKEHGGTKGVAGPRLVPSGTSAIKWGDEINITNNLPYARDLENGSSKQASGPNAILGRTLIEMRETIQKALRKLG